MLHLKSRVVLLGLAMASVLAPDAACAQSATRGELVARMVRWTGVAPKAIVAVTPDIVVALIRRGEADGVGGLVQGVELEGEIVDESREPTRTWRSMRTLLDANCAARSVRINQMEVFPEHNRKGAASTARTPQGWIQPSPEAYLANVMAAVCDHAAPAAERIAAVKPPAPPPPAPSPPAGAVTPANFVRAAVPAVPSQPAGGALIVQIAALSTPQDAQAALKALTGRAPLTPGLEARIETALVHGRRFHRVQVAGFASSEDAKRFCAVLRAGGGSCFVR